MANKKHEEHSPVGNLVRFRIKIRRADSTSVDGKGKDKAKVAPRRCGIPRRFDESLDKALFKSELADHFALNRELLTIELARGHLGCAAEILDSTKRWFYAHAAGYVAETGDRRYFKVAKRLYKALLFKAQHDAGKEQRI